MYTIPPQYEIVGERALENCKRLEKLVIPGTVREIKDYAFQNCSNLREVRMEEGVQKLGFCMFSRCDAVQRLTVPDSVIEIMTSAFSGMGGLCEPVLNSSGTEYVYYPYAMNNMEDQWMRIPEGIRVIREYAFKDSKVEEVLLPDSLERICRNAFESCNIRRLTLPPGLKYVAEFAFCHCRDLKEVYVLCDPSVVQTYAFYECRNIVLQNLNTSQQVDLIRMQGKKLFKEPFYDPKRGEVPSDGHESDPRFLKLAEGCLMGEQESMTQMADYFHEKRITGHPFYERAENFWRLYLFYWGTRKRSNGFVAGWRRIRVPI